MNQRLSGSIYLQLVDGPFVTGGLVTGELVTGGFVTITPGFWFVNEIIELKLRRPSLEIPTHLALLATKVYELGLPSLQ